MRKNIGNYDKLQQEFQNQIKTKIDNKFSKEVGCSTTLNDYKLLCGDSASRAKTTAEKQKYFEYVYERRSWSMACADPTKDNKEDAEQKITFIWNDNQRLFKCDSVTFKVPNGNILKLSMFI